MKDFHIHTIFSFDSSTPPEAYIDYAMKNNFNSICFTEHDEILDSSELFEKYLLNIKKIQSKYNLLISIGIELDITQISKISNKIFDSTDFILGSFHQNSKTPVDYYANFYNILMSENKLNLIDSIAHIDFPLRYSNFAQSFFEQFSQSSFYYIEQIINLIFEKKIILELNSENFFGTNEDESIEFWKRIIEIYKKIGGKYFTYGSDSHNLNDFVNNITNRETLLNALGLKESEFITYKNHKII